MTDPLTPEQAASDCIAIYEMECRRSTREHLVEMLAKAIRRCQPQCRLTDFERDVTINLLDNAIAAGWEDEERVQAAKRAMKKLHAVDENRADRTRSPEAGSEQIKV